MSDNPRQKWMTAELEAALKLIACDGCITCEQAQSFAEEHTIRITDMKSFVDCIGLKVSGCRGLCV